MRTGESAAVPMIELGGKDTAGGYISPNYVYADWRFTRETLRALRVNGLNKSKGKFLIRDYGP